MVDRTDRNALENPDSLTQRKILEYGRRLDLALQRIVQPLARHAGFALGRTVGGSTR